MATKQKSGLYRTKIKIGVDQDGKDIVKWLSGRTKAELEEARRLAYEHYVSGQGAGQDRLFGEYAVEWYRTVKEPRLSASSKQSYRTALNKELLPEFGDRNIRAISAMDLQKYVNRFAGMSATKITMTIATLKGIFEAACADRIISVNPMEHIRRPAAKPPQEKQVISPAQRATIEKVCAEHPYGHYLALMYYLGVRPGEARGLQWGDIDWKKNRIQIQRDLDYKDGSKAGALKTTKSNRNIPLPKALRAILEPLRALPDVFIVRGEKGGAIAKTSAERAWVDLMLSCGMVQPVEYSNYRPSDIRAHYEPLLTPHALRHNYATMCWENGLDVYATMKLLGHASIKTTIDIYTHLSEMQMDKVAAEVDGMFENKVAQKLHNEIGSVIGEK